MKDAEITELIYSALRKRYGDSKRYLTACEVGNSTGVYQTNRLDFVAMEIWPSDGFHIHAFEVKASKGDLKHELENPDKHNVFFPHIDTFSLIAPEGIINISVVPPKWGVYAVKEDASIKCLRKPIPLHDDADYDKKMDRGFACSLLRKAIDCSLDRKLFYTDNRKAMEEAKIRLQDELTQGGRIMSKYDYEAYLWMRPLCRRLGYYSEPDENEIRDRENEYTRCQGILRNAKRLFSALDDANHEMKELRDKIKEQLDNKEEKPCV